VTINDAIPKLATALHHASEAHGRDNTFGCDELYQHHGGPIATLAGRIGADPALLKKLCVALQQLDPSWSEEPTYSGRRFCV
jgi:hypothetical protein